MTLREYLAILDAHDQLHRIKVEADPVYEIGEIAQRWMRKGGGKALLFERPTGSDFPLVINLNGTAERLRLGLGADPANWASA